MLIKTDDVDKVVKRLEDGGYLDETRLMYVEGEYLTASMVGYPSMRLCSGYEDEQIFYAGELQPDRFTSIRLDHLHTLLTSVQNGTTPLRLLTDHLDRPIKGVIDLGVMIDEFQRPTLLNLPVNKIGMTEQESRFNENQFRRTGFGEAYTPDVIAQMERGVPEIKRPFNKEYDGDRVETMLHLKKSATSDHYFLNKFDLALQKEGQVNWIKQTFYLTQRHKADEEEGSPKNRVENKYTLKEAYNLAAGRPVFKTLVNKEGQEYQAWVKLNPQNVLPNGNHELKQYHTNYGFNLDNVLSKYPIKELANEQYKQSLVDSLHRGNLQKATFVDKDGKEEKLYVSPNITLGALNVYDQNKQRIPTDKLVERQWIGKEFADDLRQRLVDAPTQKPVQTKPEADKIDWLKQEVGPIRLVEPLEKEQTQKQEQVQTPKEEIKRSQTLKQKQETPVKKRTLKQKIQ